MLLSNDYESHGAREDRREETGGPFYVKFAEFGIDYALKVYRLPVGSHRTRCQIKVRSGDLELSLERERESNGIRFDMHVERDAREQKQCLLVGHIIG